jgi:hypothetical protein
MSRSPSERGLNDADGLVVVLDRLICGSVVLLLRIARVGLFARDRTFVVELERTLVVELELVELPVLVVELPPRVVLLLAAVVELLDAAVVVPLPPWIRAMHPLDTMRRKVIGKKTASARNESFWAFMDSLPCCDVDLCDI